MKIFAYVYGNSHNTFSATEGEGGILIAHLQRTLGWQDLRKIGPHPHVLVRSYAMLETFY